MSFGAVGWTSVGVLAALGAWEGGWYLRRRARRAQVFAAARARSRALGRPLLVVGAPDLGATGGYGCGDITVDVAPSSCPGSRQLDVCRALPYADASVVSFCSCVLEYVGDADAAVRELVRVSGGEAYWVGVEPWTLTAILYPGARRTVVAAYR